MTGATKEYRIMSSTHAHFSTTPYQGVSLKRTKHQEGHNDPTHMNYNYMGPLVQMGEHGSLKYNHPWNLSLLKKSASTRIIALAKQQGHNDPMYMAMSTTHAHGEAHFVNEEKMNGANQDSCRQITC